MASLFSVSPESDPIINEVRLIVISESNSLMVLMPAFKKLDTVMPARIMVVRELSAAYASAKIVMVVSSAPANAAIGRYRW